MTQKAEIDIINVVSGKLGHLFIFGIDRTVSLDDFTRFGRRIGLGGVIIFPHNFRDTKDLKELIALLRRELPPPFLVYIDQEGGEKNRIKEGIYTHPSNREMQEKGVEIQDAYFRSSAELVKLGIDVNLAPVCDVVTVDNILYKRSFSGKTDVVTRSVREAISGMKKSGILACAKHFPGLGDAEFDPHKTLGKINLPLSEFLDKNIPPFREAISSGVEFIMTSHLLVPEWDSSPVTFSYRIIDFLRKELHYTGMILTDDLMMGAVRDDMPEAAMSAVVAGHNIVLICSDFEMQNITYEKFLSKGCPKERIEEGRDKLLSIWLRQKGNDA